MGDPPASVSSDRIHSNSWAPRLRASMVRQWPLVVVLLGVLLGLLVVASHHFRRGTFLIGCCLLAAAALRAGLPERRTGMLAVRSRTVDILTSGGFGLALVLLTVVVPRPS